MKRFPLFLLAIGTIAVALTSCNKDNEDPNKEPQFKKLVKSVTRTRGTDVSTTTYTYDKEGRLIGEVSPDETTSYTYETDLVTLKSVYSGSNTPIETKYVTKDGRVVSVTNSGSKSVMNITYNEQGQVISSEMKKENGTVSYKDAFEWTNGNLTKETNQSFGTNPTTKTYTYTFGTDRNLVNYDPRAQNIIAGTLAGTPSVNLPTGAPDQSYPETYTYEFDADKCPTKITRTQMIFGEPSVTTFVLTY